MSLLNSQSRGPINRADRLMHGSPYICLTADSRSSKHCKLCRFEIKSTQPRSQIYVPINCYSLCVNKFVKKRSKKRPQNVVAMHAGKGPYFSCAGKHGGRCNKYFTSQKPVLAFQTLRLATLGKWATTHERVFFSGKNCFWTSLTRSI